jgi:dCTP deaminase
VRLVRGRARLTTEELRDVYAKTPLCFLREGASDSEGPDERPLTLDEVQLDDEGGLLLSVSLQGRSPDGWRAARHTGIVDFSAQGAHAAEDFFEPVHARGGRTILNPGSFYVFCSRERLRIPPDLAAEMLPVDVGIGELRNNYAGFFDNGFGWSDDSPRGTPAVLEVRAHDVPFLVEHGQIFFRLTLFRTDGQPDALYGEGRASYRDQDLTLARCFHNTSTDRA